MFLEGSFKRKCQLLEWPVQRCSGSCGIYMLDPTTSHQHTLEFRESGPEWALLIPPYCYKPNLGSNFSRFFFHLSLNLDNSQLHLADFHILSQAAGGGPYGPTWESAAGATEYGLPGGRHCGVDRLDAGSVHGRDLCGVHCRRSGWKGIEGMGRWEEVSWCMDFLMKMSPVVASEIAKLCRCSGC